MNSVSLEDAGQAAEPEILAPMPSLRASVLDGSPLRTIALWMLAQGEGIHLS
jgi:hypothetical protein